MKPIHVSDDILPLGEFKITASRVLRRLKADRRPIVITQHGRPAAVLVAPDEFDRLNERERFVAAVREGLADSETGRVTDDSDLDEDLEPPRRRAKRP
jgi:prevent-host-death family protein